MNNLFRELQELLPTAPLQIGTVTAVDNGVCTIELPGGGVCKARGDAAVDDQVFFRDQVIEAVAPNLTLVISEI